VLNLMLITLLNDGTFVVIGKDRVKASPRPDKWNLRANFLVSAVLAAVPLAGSLLALWGALDSHSTTGLFAALRLPPMPYEKVETLMYLLISTSSFLTLFAARERGFFFESMPAPILLAASATSLTVTTLLASFWPKGVITGLPMLGLALPDTASDYRLWPVWALLFSVVVFLLQDLSKVAAWGLIDRFDVFSYRTGSLVGARDAVRFDDPAARAAREGAGAVEGKLLAFRAARAEDGVRDLAAAPSSAASSELERAAAGMSVARGRLSDALRARRESLAKREEEGDEREGEEAAADKDLGKSTAPAAAAAAARGDIESGIIAPGAGGEVGARGIDSDVVAWEKAAGEAEAVPSLPPLARASLGEARLRVREAGAALGEVLSAEEEQAAARRRRQGRGEVVGGGGAIGASRNSRQRQRKPASSPPPHGP
jgi:H+-transporting ATPase